MIGKPAKVFSKVNKTSDNLTQVNTEKPPSPSLVEPVTKAQGRYIIPSAYSSFGPVAPARRSQRREAGYPGLEIHGGYVTEEYQRELQGSSGIQMWDEMRKSDSIVHSMLEVAEQLIHNAQVIVTPSKENPDAQESLKAKDLVETSIFDMGNTWTDVVGEILTYLCFGFSVCSVWHRQRQGYNGNKWKSSRYTDNLWGWAGISLRSQTTLHSWDLDKKGRAVGMLQCGPPSYKKVHIPFTHAAHFRTRTERENPEGISVLRSCWRAWYIKKQLEETEAMGLERDATGIPYIIVPEGVDLWNTNDSDATATLDRIEKIVRNLRTDQFQGVVLPFGYELKVLTTAGQRPHNADKVINRWDQRIAVTLLADMLLIGHESVGSFALVQSKTRLFSSALESYAARIAGVFNGELIPRMMMLNGIPQEYWPTLKFGPVETPSLIDFGEYMKAMYDIGIYPDEALAIYYRQIGGLPPPKKGDSAMGEPREPVEPVEPEVDEDEEVEVKPEEESEEVEGSEKSKLLVVPNDPISRYSIGLDK